MFGGHGGVCITINLDTIVYVRKSALYLSNCRNTLTQSKQTVAQKGCLGTYQSDEESLSFLMDEADSGASRNLRPPLQEWAVCMQPDQPGWLSIRGFARQRQRKMQDKQGRDAASVPVMLEVPVRRDGGLRRPVPWKGRRRLTEMQAAKTSRNDVLSVFSEGSSATPPPPPTFVV